MENPLYYILRPLTIYRRADDYLRERYGLSVLFPLAFLGWLSLSQIWLPEFDPFLIHPGGIDWLRYFTQAIFPLLILALFLSWVDRGRVVQNYGGSGKKGWVYFSAGALSELGRRGFYIYYALLFLLIANEFFLLTSLVVMAIVWLLLVEHDNWFKYYSRWLAAFFVAGFLTDGFTAKASIELLMEKAVEFLELLAHQPILIFIAVFTIGVALLREGPVYWRDGVIAKDVSQIVGRAAIMAALAVYVVPRLVSSLDFNEIIAYEHFYFFLGALLVANIRFKDREMYLSGAGKTLYFIFGLMMIYILLNWGLWPVILAHLVFDAGRWAGTNLRR
ncbi:MAG: hypothetical protein NUV82_00010 [Candidatus Komeilibacteria bacterium]|nr:hypothetical protein [Candidatus Komeilibacteria bacterium]